MRIYVNRDNVQEKAEEIHSLTGVSVEKVVDFINKHFDENSCKTLTVNILVEFDCKLEDVDLGHYEVITRKDPRISEYQIYREKLHPVKTKFRYTNRIRSNTNIKIGKIR